jgi:hypothetical protein
MSLRVFVASSLLFALVAMLVNTHYRLSKLEAVVQKNAYVLGYTSEVGADVCEFSLAGDSDSSKLCQRPKIHYVFAPTFGR